MTEDAVRAFGVDFDYPRESVLRGLDLRVPRGSVYGLLGRNGSGKTTLGRLLLGTLWPKQGRCEVLGLDPTTDAIEIRGRVGYVPQESDFDPLMSVDETLRFLRSFFPERWRDDFVARQLDRFGFYSQGDKKVGTLSGGLRQRLALVAALAIDPEVLVLDEPTAGLDAVVRRDFAETLVTFMEQEGRTILLFSHLLHEVERLADYVGILRYGEVTVEASVDELKRDFLRVTARFQRRPEWLSGVVSMRQLGERWQLSTWARDEEERTRFLQRLERHGAEDVTIADSSLESIFIDLVEGDDDEDED